MAEYLIQEESLKAIADVLRKNTRTTGKIAVADMPEEITLCRDQMITGMCKNSLYSEVSSMRQYAFYGCTITAAVLPNVTTISYSAFYLTPIGTIDAPKAETVAGLAFSRCTSLKNINLPATVTIDAQGFSYCKSLVTADFPAVRSIGNVAFLDCTALTALILRADGVATLGLSGSNYNDPLKGTPIASGTGYVYVPAALIEAYKVAENWSAYAAQFRALEDYTVDGTTTGALDAAKIAA